MVIISIQWQIKVGDYTLTNDHNSYGFYSNGMVIKYSSEGEVEWAKEIEGSGWDNIKSVASTRDGGYIAGGYFDSSSIQVGDYTLTNSDYYDGMIIKYDANGEVEWATSIGGNGRDYINSVSGTSDGGYIVGGDFNSETIQVGEYTFTNSTTGSSDGMIIKYDAEGEVEWAKAIGGGIDEKINSVSGTSDGGYIAGGNFQTTIKVGEYILENNGDTISSDGMIIKYSREGEVEWATSVGGSDGDYINSVAEY